MKILHLNQENINISTHATIIDRGDTTHATITIDPWIQVHYVFVGRDRSAITRLIQIGAWSTLVGSGIVFGERGDLEIITEITGDSAMSHLSLLGLSASGSDISIRWIAHVTSPYRHVVTRVDQTHILLGESARIQWTPTLEIATDDIEGGHSCKVHRLGGEALFYLESRWLSEKNAEALLLDSEIKKHLSGLSEADEHMLCGEIHAWLREIR